MPAPSPLLFRQVCILAAMAGMLAFRYPHHGVLAGILLALFTLPFSAGQFRLPLPEKHKTVLFVSAFCLGLTVCSVTTLSPLSPEQYPAWVRDAAVPGDEPGDRFKNGVRIAGTVRETDFLGNNRVRILLKDVRADGEAVPLPGMLAVTWQNPPPDIAEAGPGQRLAVTLRMRKIQGFANPGVWETENYWRDRGVYFRAWTKDDASRDGKNPPYTLEGDSSLFWRARTTLRAATLKALLPETDAGHMGGSQPSGAQADGAEPPNVRQNTRDASFPDWSATADPAVSPGAATIPALLFGDRSLFSQKTLDRVAKATLVHSLALSGMHLGFAAAIGYGMASLLQFLFPSLFLRLPRQKAGLALALPVCLVYLWIGGSPPSLIRAALMLLFWGGLLWLNRPKVLLDGLLGAVGLILLVTPSALFDIRLQLSAVSVAGIALVSPFLERLAAPPRTPSSGKPSPGLFRIVAGMALISVTAQAAALPIVLYAFPGTGLWFPLNLVWLPILGMWVMPLSFAGLFCAALGLIPFASGLFFLARIPCDALFALLEFMDSTGILAAPVALRPALPAAAGYWIMLLILPMVAAARSFSRRTLTLFCTALILGAAPAFYPMIADRADFVRLQLLDVGQGQSAVISWNAGGKRGRMLIDGGGFTASTFDTGRQIVTPVLTDGAPPHLDWVVNTHPDTDHLRGLLFPLETFSVGAVAFAPDGPSVRQTPDVIRCKTILSRRSIPARIWAAGDTIVLSPGLSVEVLHPSPNDNAALSSNNASLVLRLVWHGTPLALICGDIERKGIRSMLKRGAPLTAQVLVLPHHGAANAQSSALYDAVKPELALASCGYGSTVRPAKAVRDALGKRNISILSTAAKGQIAVLWTAPETMKVSHARE